MKVWKKEFSPCEGEVAALRRGEEWDPIKFKQVPTVLIAGLGRSMP